MPDLQWAFWPADQPRPTGAEYAAAEARYETEQQPLRDAGDMSDGTNCGLRFMMATYNRWIWWPFFFPDDPPLDPMVDFPDWQTENPRP